ncbi:MAG: cyclodeaminase/cyclohydrolase family protein [Phycisphaerae bacterium]|nr:cyclodeaminase/cyclohydrolase family protein [Phycisphaerae bacterium]
MSRCENLLELSVSDFLAATAERSATPGGGSVAGVVGALATALGQMSLNFTRGKRKYAEHADAHDTLAARLDRARAMFEQLVSDDATAYRLYREATRQEDGADKDRAVALATAAAIDVPREVAKLSLALLRDLAAFAPTSNKYLITDLLSAGALAAAACRLCDYNVRVNLPNVSDGAAAEDIRKASADDLAAAEALRDDLERAAEDWLAPQA